MWSFIGNLFGSSKAIEKTIEVTANGLDKLFYTDEEKATDGAKERAQARGMLIDWVNNTQGQNLARRLLALIVTGVWLFMYLISTAVDVTVLWISDKTVSSNLIATGDQIGDRAIEMNGAMMLILGFYFAAPHLGSIVGPALDRFSKNRKKD